MMKEFTPCFGENDVQVAESSISTTIASQNVATCVYQYESSQAPYSSCFITITWTKNLMGEDLTAVIMDDSSSGHKRVYEIQIQPWLFSKRKGTQTLVFNKNKLDLFWDLTSAKLAHGPEPLEGFYLAVVLNQELVLLLGDLKREACKKIEEASERPYNNNEAVLTYRREHIYGKRIYSAMEHIYGKRIYSAMTQFCDKGKVHEITIEFGFDTIVRWPCLEIKVDKKVSMEVKRLDLNFRGNRGIWVDGFPVEVIWDVHGWLFGKDDDDDDDASGVGGININNTNKNALFLFQTHFSLQKMRAHQSDEDSPAVTRAYTQQLMEQSQIFQPPSHDFTLVLHAWKIE